MDDIRGAVEWFKMAYKNKCYEKGSPMDILVSLAERVEKVLGMGEVGQDACLDPEIDYCRGYNQAIKEVKEVLNGQY